MKKILIILFFLLPLALFGQKQFIRSYMSNDSIYFYHGLSLMKLGGYSTTNEVRDIVSDSIQNKAEGYDITKYGFASINSYVVGYNYVSRAFTSTTPVTTDKNYYIARCGAGTTTFTNFTNGGTPYAVTVGAETMIALKYDTPTWSHTVLPFTAGSSITASTFENKDIIVPEGIYLMTGTCFYEAKSMTGVDRDLSMIMNMDASAESLPWLKYSNVSLYNFRIADYYRPVPLEMYNCKVVAEAGFLDGSDILVYLGQYNTTVDYTHTFENVIFQYSNVYAGIWGNRIAHIDIKGCSFSGTTITHPIRINSCTEGADISYNYINGGTTGIFLGSQRTAPIENINVHHNEVYNQTQEGISFDGFGDDWSLVPVIANGLVSSVTNDGTGGRLKIVADLKARNSTTEIDYPISGRTDWTTFYFAFEEGSGMEGLVCKIYGYDADGDALILDSFESADSVTVGGLVGVHAGFFNCNVSNNIIHDIYGTDDTYGTAIAIYLNVFGFTIENNNIYGCANGIALTGGQMLTTYHTLAYNNTVKGNSFSNCNNNAVRFISIYGSPPKKQYGNKFIDNTVIRSNITMDHQYNFIFDNNNLDNCTYDFTYMQDVLPTASADYVGRKFLLFTNNGSGVPTEIKEYVCKLSGGVYSWSPISDVSDKLDKAPIDSLGTVGSALGFYDSSGDTIPPYTPVLYRENLEDVAVMQDDSAAMLTPYLRKISTADARIDSVHVRSLVAETNWVGLGNNDGRPSIYGYNTGSLDNTAGVYGRVQISGTGTPSTYAVRGTMEGNNSSARKYALYGYTSDQGLLNYGVFARAEGGSFNFAGYFYGNTSVTRNTSYIPVNTGNVVASTGITYAMCSATMVYNGGSAIDISANPQIEYPNEVYDGMKITIIGSSDTNTLTLDDGTGLALSGQMVLGIHDSITLIYVYSLSTWVEVSRSNN